MSEVYNYPIGTFQDGAIDSDRLTSEIIAVSGLEDLENISQANDVVFVSFPKSISADLETTLGAIVASHRDAEHYLPTVKQTKFHDIDGRTDELVKDGFTYNGIRYELYLEAQVRLLGMLVVAQYLTYPILYNSKDDTSVLSLNNASDVQALALGALGSIAWILNSGTALKQLVRDATTIGEVAAVTDTR